MTKKNIKNTSKSSSNAISIIPLNLRPEVYSICQEHKSLKAIFPELLLVCGVICLMCEWEQVWHVAAEARSLSTTVLYVYKLCIIERWLWKWIHRVNISLSCAVRCVGNTLRCHGKSSHRCAPCLRGILLHSYQVATSIPGVNEWING